MHQGQFSSILGLILFYVMLVLFCASKGGFTFAGVDRFVNCLKVLALFLFFFFLQMQSLLYGLFSIAGSSLLDMSCQGQYSQHIYTTCHQSFYPYHVSGPLWVLDLIRIRRQRQEFFFFFFFCIFSLLKGQHLI